MSLSRKIMSVAPLSFLWDKWDFCIINCCIFLSVFGVHFTVHTIYDATDSFGAFIDKQKYLSMRLLTKKFGSKKC